VEGGGRGSGKPMEVKIGKDEGVVRVGELVVRLNGKEGSGVRKVGSKGGENAIVGGAETQEPDKCKLIRKYRPAEADIAWARSGVVAMVRDGEFIPLTKNRLLDVGWR
jgi:hypothetical protein